MGDNVMSDPNRGNTVIRAKSITIDSALDITTNQSQSTSKQSGFSVSVSNSLVDSVKSIDALVDAAGNTDNLALIATGAGRDSNIAINGSTLNATNNALFQADNNFNVNGVAQNSSTRSTNKSSSMAIGGFVDTNGSVGITASASRGKGYANSDSVTYANSQINVGGISTFSIGNDVNIKGGGINTDKVQGVIGGDMTMESLQDTYRYNSSQKNIGVNADIAIKGAGSSLSINGGKTSINAESKIVGEQTGLFAQEADLTANGKGTFTGAVFTTSKDAHARGKSNIIFNQGMTSTDIQNISSYDGTAIQAGISIGNTTGKPQANMNGLGYGSDKGDDSSVTKGGVSGFNDPQDIFTTDNRDALAGKLESGFDATRVNEELGAQTQITKEFGKEAPKAVAEFSQNRINVIKADPSLSINEKLAAIAKWDEGGVYRVTAHTALGALGTGSLEGALTTGGVAAAAPTLNDVQAKVAKALIDKGMSEDIANGTANGVISLALLGAGTAAGLDTSSTVTATNVDAHNRQLHSSEMQKLNETARELAKKYGRDAEYWKSLLYAVTYAELDKKGNNRLSNFKKDFEKQAYSQSAKSFQKVIENDLAIAQKSYNSLKAKYGNVKLNKDQNASANQSKPIYMFNSSGYYNENSIYGTYGGSYQGNRNNQKKFNEVSKSLNDQMSDIATRDDRINPLFPEQYYIPLSELKSLSTVGATGAKKIAQSRAEKKAAQESAQKAIRDQKIENNFYSGGAKFESNIVNNKPKANLRLEYEFDVDNISVKANNMLKSGKSEKEVAYWVVEQRNILKTKYRGSTPADKLREIEERNLSKYGNSLGPSAEYLNNKGKTWAEIIESSSRAGGSDLDFAPPGFNR